MQMKTPPGGDAGRGFMSGRISRTSACAAPGPTVQAIGSSRPPERCDVSAVRPARSGHSPRCSDTASNRRFAARRNRSRRLPAARRRRSPARRSCKFGTRSRTIYSRKAGRCSAMMPSCSPMTTVLPPPTPVVIVLCACAASGAAIAPAIAAMASILVRIVNSFAREIAPAVSQRARPEPIHRAHHCS